MPIDISRFSSGVALPKAVASEVLAKMAYESAFLQAANPVAVPGTGASVQVVSGRAQANFVGETDEIGVSRPSLGVRTLTPLKIAVMTVMSKEAVRDLDALYQAVVADLPSAIGIKLDQTIAGTAAPGSDFSVLGDAVATEIDYTKFGAGVAQVVKDVSGANGSLSHWITSPAFYGELITATDATGRPLYTPGFDKEVGAVYGAPVLRAAEGLGSTIAIAGDFSNAIYGVVDGVTVSISDQATVKDGSKSINLFSQEMVAIKAVAHVGFAVNDKAKFRVITKKA